METSPIMVDWDSGYTWAGHWDSGSLTMETSPIIVERTATFLEEGQALPNPSDARQTAEYVGVQNRRYGRKTVENRNEKKIIKTAEDSSCNSKQS